MQESTRNAVLPGSSCKVGDDCSVEVGVDPLTKIVKKINILCVDILRGQTVTGCS